MSDNNNLSLIDSNGWFTGALQKPSANFNERPLHAEIDMLVIHSISLPPGEFGGPHIEDFFLNRLNRKAHPYFNEIGSLKVSAHFYINREGELVQFVSVFNRAWHAGDSCWFGKNNCNDFSLGVELEGCDDQPFTQRQYKVLARLTRLIRQRFPAITPERIVGHADIAPGRKTDPGPLFDWQHYRQCLS